MQGLIEELGDRTVHTRSVKDGVDGLLGPYERLLKRKHSVVVGGF